MRGSRDLRHPRPARGCVKLVKRRLKVGSSAPSPTLRPPSIFPSPVDRFSLPFFTFAAHVRLAAVRTRCKTAERCTRSRRLWLSRSQGVYSPPIQVWEGAGAANGSDQYRYRRGGRGRGRTSRRDRRRGGRSQDQRHADLQGLSDAQPHLRGGGRSRWRDQEGRHAGLSFHGYRRRRRLAGRPGCG